MKDCVRDGGPCRHEDGLTVDLTIGEKTVISLIICRCPECGKLIDMDYAYCPYCGTEVVGE